MSDEVMANLRDEIEREMDMMTAVSTGGPRIEEVQGQYRERRRRIRQLLRSLGLEDPNPHLDLWQWYGKWSRDLPKYSGRRTYIREIFQPLLNSLDELEGGLLGSELPDAFEPVGWESVDGQIAQLRIRLTAATSPEDGQAIGLLCRDIMISIAAATYDPAIHNETGSSAVDQLYSVVDYYAAGSENQKLRKLLKATIDYANVVQHRRELDLAEAGLVAEATVGAANLVRRLTAT